MYSFYIKKIIQIALLSYIGFSLHAYIVAPFEVSENTGWGYFLHVINLIFHEAGHPIFGIFANDTMMYLGGSVFQVLIPCICFIYFLRRNAIISSGIMLLWVATNISEVAIYAGDAIDKVLPLLGGGDESNHDWYNILSAYGKLSSAPRIHNTLMSISEFVYFAGFMIMILPVFFEIYNIYIARKEITQV